MNGRREELAFIGDVHLDCGDDALPSFLACLDTLAARAGHLVFLGDLFNLWIGARGLERPHQTAVLDRLARARDRGVALTYVEGNRDYRIASGRAADVFHRIASSALELEWAGRRLHVAHGDLVNAADRQYRAWRRISRSRPFWALVGLFPSRSRLRLADRLERRMRKTNLRMKRSFPEERVRAYGAAALRSGCDAVVLGHFHEEHRIEPGDPPGSIFVLPDWKSSRRVLRVGPDGAIAFRSCTDPQGEPGDGTGGSSVGWDGAGSGSRIM